MGNGADRAPRVLGSVPVCAGNSKSEDKALARFLAQEGRAWGGTSQGFLQLHDFPVSQRPLSFH